MGKTIYIFGDSLVFGDEYGEKNGWVHLLKDFVEINNYDAVIYNFGVCGDTTEELLQRFKNDCGVGKPDIIIFAIGINDSKYIGKDKIFLVSLEKFEKNLKELINQAKNFTENIIFIGITDVDETRTLPVFWEGEDTETFFNKSNINLYNTKVREISKANKLQFVDMSNLLNSEDLEDGLHPSTQGYQKMFKRIKDNLIL